MFNLSHLYLPILSSPHFTQQSMQNNSRPTHRDQRLPSRPSVHDAYPCPSDSRENPLPLPCRRFPTVFGVLVLVEITTLLVLYKCIILIRNSWIHGHMLRLIRCIPSLVESHISASTIEQLDALILSDELHHDQKAFLAENVLSITIGTLPTTLIRNVLKQSHPCCHIQVVQGLYMHLHHITGPVDPSFTSEVDELVASQYEPLRHYIASQNALSEHDDEHGKEITILRLAKEYHPLKQISSECLQSASRFVHLDDDEDIRLYYQQVADRQTSALASEQEKSLLLKSAVAFLCLSYRHQKNSPEQLGLAESELLNALRKFRRKTRHVAKSGLVSIWWDSNLKCRDEKAKTCALRTNWVAIGLAPYCLGHVLSIRRSSSVQDERFWIDMEQACARASKGMTVVYLDSDGSEDIRIAPGNRGDPIGALENVLYYFLSGDMKDCAVTFPEDKDMLRVAAVRMVCHPMGLTLFRALFGDFAEQVYWVDDLGVVLARVFGADMRIKLGKETMDFGEGDSFVDVAIDHPAGFVWDRKKIWYPDCELWGLGYGQWSDNEWDKESKLVEIRPFGSKKDVFCMLYWYQKESIFRPELVHGVIANMGVEKNGNEYIESTSRAVFTNRDRGLLKTLAVGVECVEREWVRQAAIRLCDLNEAEYDAKSIAMVVASDSHWLPTKD